MKAIKNFATILLTSQILFSAASSAQGNLAFARTRNIEPASTPDKVTAVPQLVSLDKQSQNINIDFTMPAFTYSAVLMVQDFTGRTLKTMTLNPHGKISAELPVNDMLAGTYSYTIVLDNQKKVSGQFSLND